MLACPLVSGLPSYLPPSNSYLLAQLQIGCDFIGRLDVPAAAAEAEKANKSPKRGRMASSSSSSSVSPTVTVSTLTEQSRTTMELTPLKDDSPISRIETPTSSSTTAATSSGPPVAPTTMTEQIVSTSSAVFSHLVEGEETTNEGKPAQYQSKEGQSSNCNTSSKKDMKATQEDHEIVKIGKTEISKCVPAEARSSRVKLSLADSSSLFDHGDEEEDDSFGLLTKEWLWSCVWKSW